MDRRQSIGSGLFGTNTMDIPGKNGLKPYCIFIKRSCDVSAWVACVLETAQWHEAMN